MQDKVLDEFKDILLKVNRTFDIYHYTATLIDNKINIHYEYSDWFYPNNFLNTYNNMLVTKIYRMSDTLYWGFDTLKDIRLNITSNHTDIHFTVSVWTAGYIENYLILLPKEILTLITEYLGIVDTNNFCVFMKTWELCDEDLYRTMYIDKYPEFFRLIKPYLNHETNSWYSRYNAVLWEDVDTVDQLYRKYLNLKPRSAHINFILLLYTLLHAPRINPKVFLELYDKNIDLFLSIFRNMNSGRRKSYITEIEKFRRVDILLDMRNI